jgi:tetratricopeptide (TPR) repeat protein
LALEFFKLTAEHFSIEDILHNHSIFKMDSLIELLEKLYEVLPDSEKTLLESSSVFRSFFSVFALKWLGGEIEEMKLLLKKNLIMQAQAGFYYIPPLIREFAIGQLKRDEEKYKKIHSRAASFFEHSFQSSSNVKDLLEAHYHHFEAGEYESAAQIVQTLSEPLYRWGYLNLVKDLNTKVVSTMEGKQRAVALHRVGIVLQAQGKYREAIGYHEESLKIFAELGAKKEIAAVKHELGTIHYACGDYESARSLYEESLGIAREIQDSTASATTLHQLGMLYQKQGDYLMALAKYEQSLRIAKELGDENGIVATLSQLGTVYRELKRYEEALNIYEECLKIVERAGDRSATGLTKWAIGLIYQEEEKIDEAVELYKESLEVFEDLGELSNLSGVLHQLGTIYQSQNVFPKAVEMYERSLKIKKEIGDKAGVAETLHQLGRIHHLNKEYKKAIRNYTIAAFIFKEIKSPYEKIALNNLDKIMEEIGKEEFKKCIRSL